MTILRIVLVAALCFWAGVRHSDADTIHLKNGNVIEGRILQEEGGMIVISTGATELSIPLDAVDRVERGMAVDFFRSQADKALETGRGLMQRGNMEEARRVFEAVIVQLEEELDGLDGAPGELGEALNQLNEERRKTLPRDETSQRVEDLYQRALVRIDHIDYRGAYDLLRQAADLQPARADVQFRLGRVAGQLDRSNDAILAYRAALTLDPETYYRETAAPLLTLMKDRGRRLVAERRADAALELYKDIIILESAAGAGTVAGLQEYLARKTALDEQPEEEVLMRVYRYADDLDLVDLAFAAITQVAVLNPEDETVRELRRRAEFYSSLKAAVDGGDVSAAARLMANAPAEYMEGEGASRRVANLTGDLREDLEARRLLRQATQAFDQGNYREAAALARRVATEFPESEAATEAAALLLEAELEAPIKIELDAVRRFLTQRQYDEAEQRIEEVLEIGGVEESEQYGEIQRLSRQIPREKEADRLYDLARTYIDQSDYDRALETLDEVVGRFPETHSGKLAIEWLRDYRNQLAREARTDQLVRSNSFFSFADPNLWRAASYSVSGPELTVPAVERPQQEAAWRTFRALYDRETAAHREYRSTRLYIWTPLALGALILLGIMWKTARPGKGRMKEPVESTEATDPITGVTTNSMITARQTTCRMCGLRMPIEALVCPHCDEHTQLSEIEQERHEASDREADYDPWESKVVAKLANEYEKYFQEAQELAQTSDVAAAIDKCRKALHEDPHRKEGYQLLAELYERTGKTEEAARCYREILMLDPADILTRQKVESLLRLADRPLNIKGLIVVLSFLTWWMIFWLVFGIDSHMWGERLGMCIVGFSLMVILWIQMQNRYRLHVQITHRTEADVHRPLPSQVLTWKEQERQAKMLASSIEEHTGIDVPTMSIYRTFSALVLSLGLLAVVILVAWINQTFWVFLAWPAGAALFYYLLEVHPRVVSAHAVLRHTFEETASPWMDPHRPFKPKKLNVAGEFLIRRFDELPLRWAFNPIPYGFNRQAVLNSLQQTLNRHWACHRFYGNLHIVRGMSVPMPTGATRLMSLITMVALLGAAGSGSIAYLRTWQEKEYEQSITLGHRHLLDGRIGPARMEFYRAMRVHPNRALPNLYMAHADQAAGLAHHAERSFRVAVRYSGRASVAYNDYGNFLQRQGRLREATAQYLRALEFDENNTDILNNLGSAYFKLREYERAASTLKRAIESDGNNGRAYTTLGLAYEEMGSLELAREAFESAVRIAPDLPYTEIAKDRLEHGLRTGETVLPERQVSMAP